MNCFTVVNGQIQIGIALNKKSENDSLSLVLGEKTGQAGQVREIFLAPKDPASHVLVGGGVNLMRTAQVQKSGDGDSAIFLFSRAKIGLRPDSTDNRALVLLEYVSESSTPGYTPKSYHDIPVHGFKVLEYRSYRVEALLVLQPGEYFRFYDKQSEISWTISYRSDPGNGHHAMLECVKTLEHRKRDERMFVTL